MPDRSVDSDLSCPACVTGVRVDFADATAAVAAMRAFFVEHGRCQTVARDDRRMLTA